MAYLVNMYRKDAAMVPTRARSMRRQRLMRKIKENRRVKVLARANKFVAVAGLIPSRELRFIWHNLRGGVAANSSLS
jgi:hypothetical protein